jgi:two-component system sensor histidine kinase BaeS
MRHTARALGVFLVLFLGTFSVGVFISRDQWQTAALKRVSAALDAEAATLVGVGGDLQGEAVNRTMMRVIDPSVFVVVFQSDGSPVFWSYRGRSWYHEDAADEAAVAAEDPTAALPPGNPVANVEARYRDLFAAGRLVPLRWASMPVGSFYLERQSFAVFEEDGEFLTNLSWALVASLLGAAAGTTLFAWKAFRHGARQAGRVEAGLTAIAAGQRHVRFAPAGSRELEGIAASALKLQDALSREQDLRRRWTQDIAHDLKTPLSALRVQLEALQGGLLAASPERLAILLEEVGRLEALTSSLLVLSRLESPELRLDLQPLELSAFLPPLRNLVQPLAEAEVRSLAWTQGEGHFVADPDLLHRALANLLVNAVSHAEGSGSIEAVWSADEAGLHGRIRNPGRWLGQEQREFHRLHRGEASRTGRGNGLGLTIASTVIALHGGTLILAETPAGTVEARVDLPCVRVL